MVESDWALLINLFKSVKFPSGAPNGPFGSISAFNTFFELALSPTTTSSPLSDIFSNPMLSDIVSKSEESLESPEFPISAARTSFDSKSVLSVVCALSTLCTSSIAAKSPSSDSAESSAALTALSASMEISTIEINTLIFLIFFKRIPPKKALPFKKYMILKIR